MNDPNSELVRFPGALRTAIESELDSDERIAWVGRPSPRPFVVDTILLLILAVPFTLFPVIMIAAAAGFKIPGVNVAANQSAWFGVPFLLVGLVLLSTPYRAVRIARRTGYVLTDRRAIIFDGGRRRTIHTFLPDRMRNLTRTERRDGSGGLIFLRSIEHDHSGEIEAAKHGFLAIPEVKQVEALVRRLVEEHGRAKP
jgi:hypothetical protein